MESLLRVENLSVAVEDVVILRSVDLTIHAGEVHVIMGPNGAGKSTLSKVLAGDSSYRVVEGRVWFLGKDLLAMTPDERSHLGLFVGFQNPVEIPGVNNREFLRAAVNASRKALGEEELADSDFDGLLKAKMSMVGVDEEFCHRQVNEGLSGGEKKRNEILQMALLDPRVAVLDEVDSGLDVDALKAAAEGIKKVFGKDKALLLITHYERLLGYLEPTHVHVMKDGEIVERGGFSLVQKIEQQGYDWLAGEGRC